MSILSPHLREQKFGRRIVCYALQDGRIVADPSRNDGHTEDSKKLVLQIADGSIGVADAHGWNISCKQDDIITQVFLSPLKGKKKKLAAVINRNQRERQRTEPLGLLLHNARVSRAFIWWMSFIVLVASAIVTECGFYAREIDSALFPLHEYFSGPALPFVDFISQPLNGILGWLPLPNTGWSSQVSSMFGSLQDHSAILFLSVFLIILIVWFRSFRVLTIPLFVLCLFILKTGIYGFSGAQGTVLFWYAPLLSLLVLTGAVNRLRDRWRMAARLSDICKSLLAQPLPQNMIKKPPHTSEAKPEASHIPDEPPFPAQNKKKTPVIAPPKTVEAPQNKKGDRTPPVENPLSPPQTTTTKDAAVQSGGVVDLSQARPSRRRRH